MKKKELPGYRIYKQEPLPETFGRVIKNQLQHALLLSRKFPETPDYVTHEIRKSTKRIRAVYRLFRPAIGNENYLHGRTIYADLSRYLAHHRLSAVYCDMLRMVAADKKKIVNPSRLDKLIKEMEKRHRNITDEMVKKHHTDSYLAGIISTELTLHAAKPLLTCDIQDLSSGIKKTYGTGRKCLDQVIQQPSAENLHELRKIVKALWNMLILIRPLWPSYYGFQIHHLDLLAQKLGLEHDLAELEKMLGQESTSKDMELRMLLLDIIAKKRPQLQRLIIPLARRFYADKPGEVARKIEFCYGVYVGRRL